jgi:hypothetical protein
MEGPLNRIRPHSSWATDHPRLSPSRPSLSTYPHQPRCSSLTEPGPNPRSGQIDFAQRSCSSMYTNLTDRQKAYSAAQQLLEIAVL